MPSADRPACSRLTRPRTAIEYFGSLRQTALRDRSTRPGPQQQHRQLPGRRRLALPSRDSPGRAPVGSGRNRLALLRRVSSRDQLHEGTCPPHGRTPAPPISSFSGLSGASFLHDDIASSIRRRWPRFYSAFLSTGRFFERLSGMRAGQGTIRRRLFFDAPRMFAVRLFGVCATRAGRRRHPLR